MGGTPRWLIFVAAGYLVFWVGGNYSFSYTHKCVRSHQEERAINQDGDTETVTVCDWYAANAKRWTFLDPVRAVATAWIPDWESGAITGGIAAWIGIAIWRTRRETRTEQEQRQMFERFVAERPLTPDDVYE